MDKLQIDYRLQDPVIDQVWNLMVHVTMFGISPQCVAFFCQTQNKGGFGFDHFCQKGNIGAIFQKTVVGLATRMGIVSGRQLQRLKLPSFNECQLLTGKRCQLPPPSWGILFLQMELYT